MSRINGIYKDTYPHKAGNTEQGFIYTSKGEIIKPMITEMGRVSYGNTQVTGHEFKEWYHSHPGGGAIPSLGDLKALAIRYQQGHIKSNDFTYGVVSYYGCLSIMISSPNDFAAFAAKLRNNDFDSYWNTNINNGVAVTSFEVKIVQLLQFLQERNAGLSILFRPMQDEDLDNNNENWKAKEIGTSNQLIDTNCNN